MNNGIEKHGGKKIIKKNNGGLAGINIGALTSALDELTIPRMFYQLVIFVLDGSYSMKSEGLSGSSKGVEIGNQISPIIKRLQKSKNKNSFDISLMAFSQDFFEFYPTTNVAEIDVDKFDFNPCNHISNNQTYIATALDAAEQKANDYLQKNSSKNCQVLIIILGDGEIFDYEEAHEISERIKQNSKITIASYLLEDIEWENTWTNLELEELRLEFKKFASSSNKDDFEFFNSKVDAEEIRKHMIKSISVVSKID